MSANQENLSKIKGSFSNATRSNFWRTAVEISNLTNLRLEQVEPNLLDSRMFFRSLNRDGIPVYTTKELYNQFQTFGKRFIAAFKNRID